MVTDQRTGARLLPAGEQLSRIALVIVLLSSTVPGSLRTRPESECSADVRTPMQGFADEVATSKSYVFMAIGVVTYIPKPAQLLCMTDEGQTAKAQRQNGSLTQHVCCSRSEIGNNDVGPASLRQ